MTTDNAERALTQLIADTEAVLRRPSLTDVKLRIANVVTAAELGLLDDAGDLYEFQTRLPRFEEE